MNPLSPPPWLGHLASGLMLMLLAWLCASIYWALTLPTSTPPVTALETDPQRLAQAIGAHHLFGTADSTGNTNSADNLSSATGELRLIGAIAAQKDGRPAYALIAIEGSPPEVVREGDEVAPGIVLQRVLAREVTLLHHGRSRTLSLPEHGNP
ncbi:type II secretion system protein N [Sterolibacterium denitrificans]|nr:type II secretion system protein N [Sterolibacterium denitrificans]